MNPTILIENTFNPSHFAAVVPVGVATSAAVATKTGSNLQTILPIIFIGLIIFAFAIYKREEANKKRFQQDEGMV